MKNRISIASPCNADWKGMDGDARRRRCGQCNKHVHNLSEMGEQEADQLIEQAVGRLCVRMRTGRGGRVLHRSSRLTRMAVATVGVFASVPAMASGKVESGGTWAWIAEVVESLTAEPEEFIMGEMVAEKTPRAIENQTASELTVACPSLDTNAKLAPGESLTVDTWWGESCTVSGPHGEVLIRTMEAVCSLEDGIFACPPGL